MEGSKEGKERGERVKEGKNYCIVYNCSCALFPNFSDLRTARPARTLIMQPASKRSFSKQTAP